jgi:polar amino acid transport system ATP-binding protein
MIEIKNLSYEYDDGTKGIENINVDFGSYEGHIFAILGESGSGKTTLLNCLSKFLTPREGCVLYDGTDIRKMPEKEFRKKIGVVFQGLYLFPHMTVMRNMTLALERAMGVPRAEAEKKAMETLEKLSIDDMADSYPAQISGGQAQRVAIARGLVLDPEYMLLDEPTSALDANTTDEFGQWLTELKSRTKFIIVTHDIIFAEKFAPIGIYLSDGKVLDAGSIKDITAHVKAGKLTTED